MQKENKRSYLTNDTVIEQNVHNTSWAFCTKTALKTKGFFHHTCIYIFGPHFRKALHAAQEKIKLSVSALLVVYSFTSRSKMLHWYGDTAFSDELRAAKFRPMLGTYCLRKVRDFYRVTPAVTRGLDFRCSTLSLTLFFIFGQSFLF